MRKFLILTLAAVAALTLGSCRRAVEKAASKIRIEAIERIERHGLSGFDVTLRVKNGTGHKLRLDSARFDLYYDRSRIGDITLREGIGVPKHTVTKVDTRWRIRISDPIALYVLSRKIRRNDLSQICVSYALEGRGGPAKMNISRRMVPLPQLLRLFGLTTDDLKKHLE